MTIRKHAPSTMDFRATKDAIPTVIEPIAIQPRPERAPMISGWSPYIEGPNNPQGVKQEGMAEGVTGKPGTEKDVAHEPREPTGNVVHSYDVAMTTDDIKAWRGNKQ